MKLFSVLFLFSAFSLHAQLLEIKGRILNSADNLPLYQTNIIVVGKEIGTTSDENGSFILKANFSEHDVLRISFIGFETAEIKIVDFTPGEEKNIYLESQVITSQTVYVKGILAKEGVSPISFSKIKRKEISESYTNQDVPELLSYTPSATFYSENGNGLGYNYLSIRGFDQRRISVSINGIPQNDPEDHNVYWIDFPDLLEGTELIQIQRGAGSGITGFAAIGGAINIITSNFSSEPSLRFSANYGSYNTQKLSVGASTGLLNKKYSFYAKFSRTKSSGYREDSWSKMYSYHLAAVRYDEKLTTQLNLFGGPIEDGLAYTGLPKFAVKDKNLRRANYSYWEADDKNYSYVAERRPEEIENFFQPHFELLNEYRFSNSSIFNSALFVIIGNGFFDYDGSWADTSYFRLTRDNGFNPTQNPSNAIIRAKVVNIQWGWIPRFNLKHKNGNLIIGSEIRFHRSNHWGAINYAEDMPAGWSKDFKYYYYEGEKDILNFYVHESYDLNERINILGELQLAYHTYRITNERYLNNEISIINLFINPRFGINYKVTPEVNLYFSYAKVSREPRLKNYYDAAESSGGETPQFQTKPNGEYDFSKPLVNPETMNDLELGASYNTQDISASLNLFYMIFDDEIVKQGQLDRFGQPITGNMDKTIHTGVEASLTTRVNQNIEFILNGSVSKNYIDKGIAYFNDNGGQYIINLSGNEISGFPAYIFNTIIKLRYENILFMFTGKFVGEFYSDNYDSKLSEYLISYPGITDYTDNIVERYFTANVFASYNFKTFAGDTKLFLQINNIFDNLYATYAVGKEFFPAAERNILFGASIEL